MDINSALKANLDKLYPNRKRIAAAAQTEIDAHDLSGWHTFAGMFLTTRTKSDAMALTPPKTELTPTIGIDLRRRRHVQARVLDTLLSKPLRPRGRPKMIGFIGGPGVGKSYRTKAVLQEELGSLGAVRADFQSVAELLPEYEAFAESRDPRFSSAIRHEVALLMHTARQLAFEEGLNLIYETTIASDRELSDAKNRGYETMLEVVSAPVKEAASRVLHGFLAGTQCQLPTLAFVLNRVTQIPDYLEAAVKVADRARFTDTSEDRPVLFAVKRSDGTFAISDPELMSAFQALPKQAKQMAKQLGVSLDLSAAASSVTATSNLGVTQKPRHHPARLTSKLR